MNGRIYDPQLGRMLQADPFIQAPGNTQSYNRYSYVMNNPLGYTDPSGYFLKELASFAAAAVGYWACGPYCAGAAVTATNLAQGVEIKYAVINGVSTAALSSIASPSFADTAFAQAAGVEVGRAAAFGAVGGIASSLQGGNFGHGFLVAGVSGAIGQSAFLGGAGGTPGDIAIRTVGKAILGGTVSRVSGGKFANGAATAAFSSLITESVAAANDPNYGNVKTGDGPNLAEPQVGSGSYRRGIVTMSETGPGGYYESAPTYTAAPIRYTVFPGFAAHLANTGTLFAGGSGAVQRDGIYDMAAIGLGVPAAAATCTMLSSVCYAGAKLAFEGMAVGSSIRLATGQNINASTLAMDAAVNVVVGTPFTALGAASGPIGKWIWEFNSQAATLPMNLPPP
jgi:hypothetical protein